MDFLAELTVIIYLHNLDIFQLFSVSNHSFLQGSDSPKSIFVCFGDKKVFVKVCLDHLLSSEYL